MSVVEFRRSALGSAWRTDELDRLIALLPDEHGVTWDTGATEQGDPQFYVLGPAPDHSCILCVSRLAQGYVLQDGVGRLVGEAPALDRFAVEAARGVLRGSRSLVARATLAWITVRLTLEEKFEPIFEETEELLARFAPQLVAFV